MESLVCCFVLALCTTALAAPGAWPQHYAYAPAASAPARTMLWSGYFGGVQPWGQRGGGGFRQFLPRSYEPQGAMSAFAAGDAVHAGSFFNGHSSNGHDIAHDIGHDIGLANGNGKGNGNGNGKPLECGQCVAVPEEQPAAPPPPELIPVNIPEEELPAGDDPNAGVPAAPAAPEEPAPADEPAPEGDFDEPAPSPPPPPALVPTNGNGNGKKNGNGKPTGHDSGRGHKSNGNGNGNGKKKPQVEDEEDYSDEGEEEGEDDLPAFLPGKRGRGRGNFYNTYFPMVFNGAGRGRSGGGGGEPGAATAIANSYSKGRGAVATSHATAYGGPHMLAGNGNGQRKSKAGSRRSTPVTVE